MAQAKLQLHEKTEIELISLAELIQKRLTTSGVFPQPLPTWVDLTDPLAAAEAAAADFTQKTTALKVAVTQKAVAMRHLRKSLGAAAAYVESLADGKEQVIRSAGLDVRKRKSPIGELPAPADLRAELAPGEGRVKLRWKRVHGARIYEVHRLLRKEWATGPDSAGAGGGTDTAGTEVSAAETQGVWQLAGLFTAASAVVESLQLGRAYEFSVRAIGTAGNGSWSDIAVQRAG